MNSKSNFQTHTVPDNPLQLIGGGNVNLRLRFQKCYSLDSKRVTQIADRIGRRDGIFFDRGRGKIFVDCLPMDDGTLVTRKDCALAENDLFASYAVVPKPYYRVAAKEQLYVNTNRKMVRATLFAGPNGEQLRPICHNDKVLFIFGETNVFIVGEFDGITEKFRLSRVVLLGNQVFATSFIGWKYVDLLNDKNSICRFLKMRALSFTGDSAADLADFVLKGMMVAYDQITNTDKPYWARTEQLEQYPLANQIIVPSQKTAPKKTAPVNSGADWHQQLHEVRPKIVATAAKSQSETSPTNESIGKKIKIVKTTGKKARKAVEIVSNNSQKNKKEPVTV